MLLTIFTFLKIFTSCHHSRQNETMARVYRTTWNLGEHSPVPYFYTVEPSSCVALGLGGTPEEQINLGSPYFTSTCELRKPLFNLHTTLQTPRLFRQASLELLRVLAYVPTKYPSWNSQIQAWLISCRRTSTHFKPLREPDLVGSQNMPKYILTKPDLLTALGGDLSAVQLNWKTFRAITKLTRHSWNSFSPSLSFLPFLYKDIFCTFIKAEVWDSQGHKEHPSKEHDLGCSPTVVPNCSHYKRLVCFLFIFFLNPG